MGYTMSMDASCKVQRAAVRGYLSHTARDVDKSNGVEVRHSNEDINPARTSQNVTKVYDAATGRYRACHDSNELVEALERRLSDVKKPLRKDAVVLRPVIMQLDPEWYRDVQDEKEQKRSYNKMLKWAERTYGRDNMIGFSLHLDETNPHLHILVTPVTSDGRLSQKDWYKGPSALREMHQDLREYMRTEGFDVDLQRRKPGKHAKRLSEAEYKDYAELQRQREEVETQQQALQEQEVAVRQREAAVKQREEMQECRERALEAREEAVAAKGKELDRLCSDALKLSRRASQEEKAVVKWAKNKGYKDQAKSITVQHNRRVGDVNQLASDVRSLNGQEWTFTPGSGNSGLDYSPDV